MRKKVFVLMVMVICLGLVLIGCSSSEKDPNKENVTTSQGEKRVFKVAHVAGENHIWQETLKKFNEELQKRSNNRLSVQIFANASLGNEPDLMKQMAAGSLDMAVITTAELTNRSNSFKAWFMPFLMKDPDHATAMFETNEAKAILNSLSKDEGVFGLGYLFVESRDVTLKDKAATSLNDFKGKKIRVTPSPVILDWWKTVGASPTPIPVSELYTAFQTGVVDGIDMGPEGIISFRLHEISKNYTKTHHMMFLSVHFISQKVWDSLSPEDQKIVQEAFAESLKYNKELGNQREVDNFKKFEEIGGKVAIIEDQSALNELANQFYNKYASEDEKIKAFIDKAKEIGSK